MIYSSPSPHERIDQGDVIDACPVSSVTAFTPDQVDAAEVLVDLQRVLVLTQTCDLANEKVDAAVVALVFDAQQLVAGQVLKVADVRGPLRSGRFGACIFSPRGPTRV